MQAFKLLRRRLFAFSIAMVLIAWTQALFAQPKAKLKIFDSVGPLMPSYHIQVTEDAKADLAHYTAFERKIIVSQVRGQLSEQPKVETKNREKLRENPVASWELRVGKFRIFYEVNENAKTVVIVSVGHKDHNALVIIRGKEVLL